MEKSNTIHYIMKHSLFSILILSALFLLYSCSFLPMTEGEYIPYGESDDESEEITTPGSGYHVTVEYILAGEDDSIWYSSGTDFGLITGENRTSLYTSSEDIVGLCLLDSNTIIIETASSLRTFDITSSETKLLYYGDSTIQSVLVMGEYLVVNMSGYREVMKISNHLITDSDDRVYSAGDAVADKERSRLFYFRSRVSPNDICYQDVDKTDGSLGNEGDSTYHGSYSNIGPLHLYPDGSRIIQGNGYVFDTSDSLKIYSRIPFNFEDMIFYKNDIILFTNTGNVVRISSEAPYDTICNIATYNTTPFALISRDWGIQVITISDGKTYVDNCEDSDLSAHENYVQPAIGSDGNGLIVNMPVTMMIPGQDQTFYFSSGTGLGKINSTHVEMLLFTEQQISSLIYENTESLLLTSGYKIYRYQIQSESLELIYTSSNRINDACLAGDFLVFSASGGTYAMDLKTGLITDNMFAYYSASNAFVYDPVNSMILGETVGISPKDIEYWILDQSSGEFTEYGTSMYHGSYSFLSPYRFFPDGSKVMSASGEIFTTETRLPHTDTLPIACNWTDMFFYGDDMILLTDQDQLIRAESTSPYNVSEVIYSFSTDARTVCFSGTTIAVVTVEDTLSPDYRVKFFNETDL